MVVNNNKIFDSEVNYYIGRLKGKVKNKPVFVAVGTRQTDAFYSIAPLSKAVHESGGDMHVIVEDDGNSLSVLKDIWHVYEDHIKKLKTKGITIIKLAAHFLKASLIESNTPNLPNFFTIFYYYM